MAEVDAPQPEQHPDAIHAAARQEIQATLQLAKIQREHDQDADYSPEALSYALCQELELTAEEGGSPAECVTLAGTLLENPVLQSRVYIRGAVAGDLMAAGRLAQLLDAEKVLDLTQAEEAAQITSYTPMGAVVQYLAARELPIESWLEQYIAEPERRWEHRKNYLYNRYAKASMFPQEEIDELLNQLVSPELDDELVLREVDSGSLAALATTAQWQAIAERYLVASSRNTTGPNARLWNLIAMPEQMLMLDTPMRLAPELRARFDRLITQRAEQESEQMLPFLISQQLLRWRVIQAHHNGESPQQITGFIKEQAALWRATPLLHYGEDGELEQADEYAINEEEDKLYCYCIDLAVPRGDEVAIEHYFRQISSPTELHDALLNAFEEAPTYASAEKIVAVAARLGWDEESFEPYLSQHRLVAEGSFEEIEARIRQLLGSEYLVLQRNHVWAIVRLFERAQELSPDAAYDLAVWLYAELQAKGESSVSMEHIVGDFWREHPNRQAARLAELQHSGPGDPRLFGLLRLARQTQPGTDSPPQQ